MLHQIHFANTSPTDYSHTSQDSYTTFMITEKGLNNSGASRASILMKAGACVRTIFITPTPLTADLGLAQSSTKASYYSSSPSLLIITTGGRHDSRLRLAVVWAQTNDCVRRAHLWSTDSGLDPPHHRTFSVGFWFFHAILCPGRLGRHSHPPERAVASGLPKLLPWNHLSVGKHD